MWWMLLGCPSSVDVPKSPASDASDAQQEPIDPFRGLSVHLSIDDLPFQIQRGQQMTLTREETAAWNERLRRHLATHRAPASVFFVCDWLHEGSSEVEDWASAGHAVGNHTAHHLAARTVGPEAFLADAEACQERLAADGHPGRWFRYPYLSHGADPSSQQAIREGLGALGLSNVPIAAPTTEWVFAFRYRLALEAGDADEARLVAAAYLEHMDDALLHAEALAQRTVGRTAPHTVLVHANELNGDWLDDLLGRWSRRGVRFVGVDEVMADSLYQRPILGTSAGALPWTLRVIDEPVSDALRWFDQEEGRVRSAWPLPPEPWPTGVPVSASLSE